ncbi:hypothetical protein [Roseateles noduli]|jgi:hypothetical protein|uniref:hypothetical protein n=1 Tax=Roseateles noduli TaxID=2052484 RepID=UPI003D653B5C
MKTLQELERSHQRWKRVFAAAAFVLVLCLVDLFPMQATGLERFSCYTIGSFAVLIALLAARRLGDADRAEAVAEGQWLNAHENQELPSLPDVDD